MSNLYTRMSKPKSWLLKHITRKCPVQEAIPSLFSQTLRPYNLGTLKRSIGPKSLQRLNTLFVNLKKVQKRADYIGSVQWNSRVTSLLNKCKSAKLGAIAKSHISNDARELLYRVRSIAARTIPVSTVIADLITGNYRLFNGVKKACIGKLSKLQLLQKQLRSLEMVLLEILSLITTASNVILIPYIKQLPTIFTAIGNSRFRTFQRQTLKDIPYFLLDLLGLVKRVMPCRNSYARYLSGILTTQKQSMKKLTELYLTICLSRTGPGQHVSTSSTSSMIVHSRRDMLQPSYEKDCIGYSHQTNRLRMFSTAKEITENVLRRPSYDAQRDIISVHHSSAVNSYLCLDSGTYKRVPDAAIKDIYTIHKIWKLEIYDNQIRM